LDKPYQPTFIGNVVRIQHLHPENVLRKDQTLNAHLLFCTGRFGGHDETEFDWFPTRSAPVCTTFSVREK
jgi:hypothetical protein